MVNIVCAKREALYLFKHIIWLIVINITQFYEFSEKSCKVNKVR